MLNPIFSGIAAVAVGLLVGLTFQSWIAGILPALLIFGLVWFLLARATGKAIQAEFEKLLPLLQERKIDDAVALLEGIRKKYSRWQILLSAQIDAQLGMLDYLQMKWDAALPKLDRGKWRNWTALTCLGAIYWRKGDKPKAFESFKKATNAAPKEVMAWIVRIVMLVKNDQRDDALKVLGEALASLPGSTPLKELQAIVANKKKIETSKLPEQWYQFFPEELAQRALVKGTKGPAKDLPMKGFRVPKGTAQPKPKMNWRSLKGR